MAARRLPANDPRTIARDIPGLSDAVFPVLAQGVVANLNRRSVSVSNCHKITSGDVAASKLQRAMLFELAVAAAEQLIEGKQVIEWNACLDLAVARQRKHFDAKLPSALTEADKDIASRVAENLVVMLQGLAEGQEATLTRSPAIPGYQWIASGVGDFAIGSTLIEVKCTGKHFSSSDYRQILIYWLLSYASALEGRGNEFAEVVLLNPRLNLMLRLPLDNLAELLGGGKSKVDLLTAFASMIADRSTVFV